MTLHKEQGRPQTRPAYRRSSAPRANNAVRHSLREEALRRLWDESADEYARLAVESSTYRQTNQVLVEAAELGPGCSVVDLACGGGATLAAAFQTQPAIAHAWAVDWAQEMIEETRRRLAGRPVSYVIASAQEFAQVLWPLKVDRVLSNAAFFQFDRPVEVLRQAKRVLSPGGQLIFTLPGASNARQLRDLLHRHGLVSPRVSRRSKHETAKLPVSPPPLRCIPQTVGEVLHQAGWLERSRQRLTVSSSHEEYVRWMTLPVFRRPEWRQWTPKKLEEKLQDAMNQTGIRPTVEWLVIVAQPT